MRVSTDFSPPVESGTQLRRDLADAQRANRQLRDKLRRTQRSRDRWRAEAWYWKWGAKPGFTHGVPQFVKDDQARMRGETTQD